MRDRVIRTLVALYQTGAGVGGFWVLFGSGQFHVHAPLLIRILLTAVLAGYCGLLAIAGVFLGRGHPLGAPLSVVAQACQIPVISTNMLTYVVSTPASLVISMTSHFDLGVQLNIAAQLQIVARHHPDVSSVGVNLLALVVLSVVRKRLATQPGPMRTSTHGA